MQEENPNDAVVRLVNPPEVDESVNRGSERTVEPSSPLANELRCALRNISLGPAGLDVCEGPFLVFLRDEFEAKNPILGCLTSVSIPRKPKREIKNEANPKTCSSGRSTCH